MSFGNKVKWEKLSQWQFIGELEGYVVELNCSTSWNFWKITKDNVLVDICTRHSPSKNELSGRVQTERILLKIIQDESNA